MMDDIMQANLYDLYNVDNGGDGNVDVSLSGGVNFHSIGNGQFSYQLPDGRVVIVDQAGNIIQ